MEGFFPNLVSSDLLKSLIPILRNDPELRVGILCTWEHISLPDHCLTREAEERLETVRILSSAGFDEYFLHAPQRADED